MGSLTQVPGCGWHTVMVASVSADAPAAARSSIGMFTTSPAATAMLLALALTGIRLFYTYVVQADYQGYRNFIEMEALVEPGPVSDAKLTAPEAFRSASTGNQGKISTGWVSTFRDRDLNDMVKEALKHNLDIQEASANLKASKQTRKAARAARLPSVGFSGHKRRR